MNQIKITREQYNDLKTDIEYCVASNIDIISYLEIKLFGSIEMNDNVIRFIKDYAKICRLRKEIDNAIEISNISTLLAFRVVNCAEDDNNAEVENS